MVQIGPRQFHYRLTRSHLTPEAGTNCHCLAYGPCQRRKPTPLHATHELEGNCARCGTARRYQDAISRARPARAGDANRHLHGLLHRTRGNPPARGAPTAVRSRREAGSGGGLVSMIARGHYIGKRIGDPPISGDVTAVAARPGDDAYLRSDPVQASRELSRPGSITSVRPA